MQIVPKGEYEPGMFQHRDRGREGKVRKKVNRDAATALSERKSDSQPHAIIPPYVSAGIQCSVIMTLVQTIFHRNSDPRQIERYCKPVGKG